MTLNSWLIGIGIFASAAASAGAGSSGGGGAVVCREGKKILHAYLLDLYEGRIRHGYEIPTLNASPEAQLTAAMNKLDGHPRYKALVRQVTAETLARIQFLPKDAVFDSPEDLGSRFGVVMEDGCDVEGIGFYEADDTLKVSRSIYAAFSNTDKAAFILHESLYKIARDMSHARDSAFSRQLNAMAFSRNVSGDDIQALSEQVLDGGYAWIHEQPYFAVAGTDHYGPIAISVKPDSDQAYSAHFLCRDLDGSPIGQPVKFEGSGAAVLQLEDQGCHAIEGAAGGAEGSNLMKFKIQLDAKNSMPHLRDFVSARADSQFYVEVHHPAITLPPLPTVKEEQSNRVQRPQAKKQDWRNMGVYTFSSFNHRALTECVIMRNHIHTLSGSGAVFRMACTWNKQLQSVELRGRVYRAVSAKEDQWIKLSKVTIGPDEFCAVSENTSAVLNTLSTEEVLFQSKCNQGHSGANDVMQAAVYFPSFAK